MNILSLFDGISCGQVALNRANLNIKNYYAAEINPHSIKVTQSNYPNTHQIGSVTNLKIPKSFHLDAIIGGSPCQGFSMAGKQLNFNDPRSKLFFEYVRLYKEAKRYNPAIKFLLENVVMKKEFENVISDILEVEPIYIDSQIVSAQMRKRLYWTNIPYTKPEDKGLFLRDIVTEKDIDLSTTFMGGGFRKYLISKGIDTFVSCNGKDVLVTSEKTYLANERRIGKTRGLNEKSTCLTLSSTSIAGSGGVGLYINGKHRTINRIEAERLQTLPDNYTRVVSSTKAIEECGNGWTIDVITQFFKNL